MQKVAAIAVTLSVALALVPGAASAKTSAAHLTRHRNPIAHIAVAGVHGPAAHGRQAGPR